MADCIGLNATDVWGPMNCLVETIEDGKGGEELGWVDVDTEGQHTMEYSDR